MWGMSPPGQTHRQPTATNTVERSLSNSVVIFDVPAQVLLHKCTMYVFILSMPAPCFTVVLQQHSAHAEWNILEYSVWLAFNPGYRVWYPSVRDVGIGACDAYPGNICTNL